MKSSTLLRKETVIPAFSVSLILAFAFVMPGNAFHNSDQQCGYGYGYGQADNEDQQGDQNDNQVGNTSGDETISESGETEDAQGETGDTHVTKKTVVVHISAPTNTAP